MGLKRVSWVRRHQGQCRALRPLGHQGYRLRNHKKDQPLCSSYMVSACCGALSLVLCVPCILRCVRCGALLCWLWCPASLCRVLWRCAVVWCCAVVLCCRFAVLFVFALPSCGLLCGARVVCAVVGASCCGVSLCVVVSPLAFCGVVVLLWCVVVSCCAVRCPVVSCALCRVLRCRAALRCCAGWLCCAVVCAAGVCFSFCPLFLC